MGSTDDDGRDIDTTTRLLFGDAVKRGDVDTSPLGKGGEGTTRRLDVLAKSHGNTVSQKREECQPEKRGSNVIALFEYGPDMADSAGKPIWTVLYEGLKPYVDERTQADVAREIGVREANLSRWMLRGEVRVSSANLEKILSIDEVRLAVANAILKRPDADSVLWEAVSDSLADVMSAPQGMTLAKKLKVLKASNQLAAVFALIDGLISQETVPELQKPRRRKSAKSKTG